MLRRAAMMVCAAAVTACIGRDRLICTESSQCSREADGMCIEGGCAYPDAECDSGLRFSSLAGERAGRCVEDDAVAEDSSGSGGPGTSADTSSTTGTGDTQDDAESSAGSESTGSIPSVCDGVDCSDAGTCVVVDAMPSCACDSGYYAQGSTACVLDPCDQAACFFTDASLGDDANDGSVEAPWRTLGHLSQQIAAAEPGDHFLLRRGAVWGDEDGGFRLSIEDVTGTEDAPIVIGGYGPLADGRPRIAPGFVGIESSRHVVLRDLDIEDDPDNEVIRASHGNRPCVFVRDSEYVSVVDNMVATCDARGIWVAEASAYTAIVGNVVDGSGSDGISIVDEDWLEPIVRVNHHHWVLDNVVMGAGNVGINIVIGSEEVEIGDAKVVRNRVADAGASGISAQSTGYAWVVDNVVARSRGELVYMGALSMHTHGGSQLSGNVAFETSSNGIIVNRSAQVVANTVIHDGAIGDALAIDDGASATASRNLLWERGDGASVHVLEGVAADHVLALDDSWYVGADAGACSFRDGTQAFDLAQWRAATGFDLASSCAPVPGFGAVATDVPPAEWDAAFMAELVPDASWAACADPIGARDCEGAQHGPAIEPLVGLGDPGELGWAGPMVVRQRYDILAPEE